MARKSYDEIVSETRKRNYYNRANKKDKSYEDIKRDQRDFRQFGPIEPTISTPAPTVSATPTIRTDRWYANQFANKTAANAAQYADRKSKAEMRSGGATAEQYRDNMQRNNTAQFDAGKNEIRSSRVNTLSPTKAGQIVEIAGTKAVEAQMASARRKENQKQANYQQWNDLDNNAKKLVDIAYGSDINNSLDTRIAAENELKTKYNMTNKDLKNVRKGRKEERSRGQSLLEDKRLSKMYEDLGPEGQTLLRTYGSKGVQLLGGDMLRAESLRAENELRTKYRLSDDDLTQLSVYAEQYYNAKNAGTEEKYAQESAAAHPIRTSAATLVTNLIGSVMSKGGQAYEAVNLARLRGSGYNEPVSIDKNNPLFAATRYTNKARETVAEQQFDTKLGSFLYQTGMSLADSAIAAGISKMFPAGSVVPLALGEGMLGMSAGASTMLDLADKGATAEMSLLGGLASEAFETAFEHISISQLDTFSKVEAAEFTKGVSKQVIKDNLKLYAKKLGATTFTNATEEGFTEIANLIYDTIANGGYSQYAEYFNDARKNGATEAQAKTLAIKNMALQVLEAAAGGALMGGVFGVGGGVNLALNYNSFNKGATRLGGMVDATGQRADVVNTAEALPEGSESRRLLNKFTNSKKGLTENRLGRLAIENETYLQNADDDMLKKVEARRTEIAETKGQNARENFDYYELTNSVVGTDKSGGEIRMVNANVGDTSKGAKIFSKNKNGALTFKTSDGKTMELNKRTVEQIQNPETKALAKSALVYGLGADGANLLLDTYNPESLTSDHTAAFMRVYRQGALGTKSKALFGTYGEDMDRFTADQQRDILKAGLAEKQTKPGATDWRVAEKNNKFVSLQVKAMNAVAKALSKNGEQKEIFVVDDLYEEYTAKDANGNDVKSYRYLNGQYLTDSGKIIISARADKGLLLSFLAHEMGHEMKVNDINAFNNLAELVESHYGKEEYDKQIQKFTELGYSEEDAKEELICNSLFDVFDKNTIKKVFGRDKAAVVKLYRVLETISNAYNSAMSEYANSQDYKGNLKHADIQKLNNDRELLDGVKEIFTDYLSRMQAGEYKGIRAEAEGNEKFSIKQNVEETKDLIAVHNMTAGELEKTFSLGGFPMPSIAILKAKHGHSKYGPISVVFNKETIDPQRSRKNKVYGGDAWTPTFPTIEYKPNKKVAGNLEDLYYSLQNKYGYDAVRPLYNYTYDLERVLNNNGGEQGLKNRLYEDTNLMRLYDLTEGKEIADVYKETRKEMSEATISNSKDLIARFGADTIKALKDGGNTLNNTAKFVDDNEGAIREVYRQGMLNDGLSKSQVEEMMKGLKRGEMIAGVGKAIHYAINGPVDITRTSDYAATVEKIKSETDQAKYKQWIDDLFTGAEEAQGLYNGKDYITDNGRRSWDALHYEVTLENIVKAMAQKSNGEQVLFSGLGIWGAAVKEYNSITEIRKDKGRLQKIDDDEYAKIKQELGDRLSTIAETIVDKSEDNPFIAMDNALANICDAVRTQKSKAGIKKYLSEYQYNVTDKTVDDIVELVNDIASMPTGYFEAKPQRAVGLDEINSVIIPSDTDDSLRNLLKENGINTVEYEADNDDDRLAKLNSLENVKFSISDRDTEYMQAVKSGNKAEQQRLVDEAAKQWGAITDDKGKPTVYYHGTKQKFTVFDRSKIGSETDYGWFGKGFYFTPDKDTADIYSDKYGDNLTMPSYLKLNNPLDLNALAKENNESLFAAMTRLVGDYEGEELSDRMTDYLRENGYDGVYAWSQVMILYSNQAKSADPITYDDNGNVISLSERFNSKNEDIRYSISDRGDVAEYREYAPTFYSKMGKVVEGIKQDKLSTNGLINMLKGKGVKDEEIQWSGIEEWLADKGKSVTKQELQDFIKNSMLNIETVTLDEKADFKVERDGDETFTVISPDGERIGFYYDEDAGTFLSPDTDLDFESPEDAEMYFNDPYVQMDNDIDVRYKTKWHEYKTEGGSNYRELLFTIPNSNYSNQAMEAHWKREGVLAHTRIQDMPDADGNKMLFIDEIQSDWHNAAQKSGYAKDGELTKSVIISEIKKLQEQYRNDEALNSLFEKIPYPYSKNDILDFLANENVRDETLKNLSDIGINVSGDELKVIDSYGKRLKELRGKWYEAPEQDRAPDAPFKNGKYVDYVLKNLLRMAAENGYDKLAWTPSEMQSERWSDEFAEGYRIEYDQDMPKFLNKFGKKFGAKVGISYINPASDNNAQYLKDKISSIEELIEISEDSWGADNATAQSYKDQVEMLKKQLHGTPVWSIDITPEMKESVLYEGQPMYSRSDRGDVAEYEAEQFLDTATDDDIRDIVDEVDRRLQNVPYFEDKQEQTEVYAILDKMREKRDRLYEALSMDTGNESLAEYNRNTRNEMFGEAEPEGTIEGNRITNKGQHQNIKKADAEKLIKRYKNVHHDRGTPLSLENLDEATAKLQQFYEDMQNNPNMAWDEVYDKAKDVAVEIIKFTKRHKEVHHPGKIYQQTYNTRYYNPFNDYTDDIGRNYGREAISDSFVLKPGAEEWLAPIINDIVTDYFDVPISNSDAVKTANLKTTYKNQIQALKNQLKQVQSQARQDTRQAVKEQREKDVAYYNQRMKEIRADRDQKLIAQRLAYQKSQQNRRENNTQRELKGKILRRYQRLDQELRKPNANRYVPADLVNTVAGVLGSLTDTLQTEEYYQTGREIKSHIQRNKTLADLKVTYDAMQTSGEYSNYFDPTISALMQEVAKNTAGKTINEMDSNELQQVYTLVSALDHTVRNAAKLEISGKERDAFKIADRNIDQLQQVKKKKINGFAKYWYDQMNARTFFRQLSGYTEGGWMDVYDLLNEGQLKQSAIKAEVTEAFRELTSDKQARDLMDTKKLVDIGLRDADGNAIPVTRGIMLGIYMDLLNEDNTNHIAKGGLTVPDLEKYYKNDKEAYGNNTAYTTSAAGELRQINREINALEMRDDSANYADRIAELEARRDEVIQDADYLMDNIRTKIEQQLTDYERAWIEKAQWFFDEYSKSKLNEATMRMYGFNKANVNHYFPIRVDKTSVTPSFGELVQDMTLEGSGFMKDRQKGASNPIYAEDIVDVIKRQMDNVAAYAGLAPAIKDFNKIYGKSKTTEQGEDIAVTSVQKAVRDVFGKYGLKYISDLGKDLQGARKGEPSILSTLRGNAYQAALTLNLRVAMAQAGSFPTAAAEVGWQPILKALRHGGQGNTVVSKADRELITKYTPLLANRLNGGNSTVDINNLKTLSARSAQGVNARILHKTRALTDWISKVDAATVGRLWYAAQYYVDDNSNLQKGTDEYYQEVAKVFNRIVERTQPSYTTMQRSALLRNPNEAQKFFTMYMTQRSQNFNLLYDSAMELNAMRAGVKNGTATQEQLASAKENFGRTIASQLAAGLTLSAMKIFADAIQHNMKGYRDDDEDEVTAEKILEKLGTTWLESEISNVFLGSEIYSLISTMITGEAYYGISVNVTGALTDFTKDLKNMVSNPSPKSVDRAFRDAATILGIPSSQMQKFAKMGIYWYQDIVDGGGIYSNYEGEESNKQMVGKMVAAYLRGDMAQYRTRSEALNGKSDTSVKSAITSYVEEKVLSGDMSETEARRVFINVYGKSEKETDKKLEEIRQKKAGTYEKKESKKWGG